MNNLYLENKYVLEYLKDMLNDLKLKSQSVSNAKYHHNTNYSDAPSVIQNGLHSLLQLNKLGIKKYSVDLLKKLSDTESHVNGIDSISLSVVGLTDLYADEDEYDPCKDFYVDFLVSNDIVTSRSTIHYGNEFLCPDSIARDKIRAIDIRLINMINRIEERIKDCSDYELVVLLIKKYNYLITMAETLKNTQMDIPLREMSKSSFALDIDKLSSSNKLVLKKYV